jgi:hypothetical protein
MRCSEAEKSILLQDSGELGAARSGKLEAHLSGCASCRGFRQDLLNTGSVFNAGREPSAKAVQDVLRTARITAPTQQHQPVFIWKPAMAVAATVVLALGLFIGIYDPYKVGMEIDMTEAQLLQPEDQVVSIMYEGLSEDDLAFNFLMTFEEELEG